MKKPALKRTFALTTSNDVKGRLGVLWVLLNVSTEYPHSSGKVCEMMDAIEKFAPHARDAWGKDMIIFLDHKKVYERKVEG